MIFPGQKGPILEFVQPISEQTPMASGGSQAPWGFAGPF